MTDRKLIFFTSDTHYGHEKILEYSKRPFKDLDHMHRVLINNFNSTVPPGSLTYFLGDIGMGKGDIITDILKQLNGTKVLIIGNHDKGYAAMYKAGFDVVMHAATIHIASERVTMSHCPLLGVYREDTSGMKNAMPGSCWHGDHKQIAYSVKDEGQFHLSGHIHSPNGGKSVRVLGKQMDVGVDANGYKPISISAVESWIAKYRQSEEKSKL